MPTVARYRIACVATVILLGLGGTASGDDIEACRANHACATAHGYEVLKSGTPKGGAYGCGIRYFVTDPETRRELVVSLISGEGTILPYAIFELHFREISADGDHTTSSTPSRGWVYEADRTMATEGWVNAIRNRALVLRTDILPEERAKISKLAELVATSAHIIVVESTRGTFTHYFVVPGTSERRVAAEFLECVDDIHRNVLKLPPGLH